MRDEVGRVPVVAVVRDVLADVVEERGVLEQLAIVVVEPVQLAGLVEQLEAELRDVARVRLGPREATGERLHRRAPDRARIVGPVDRVVATDRVEHDALAQRPLADRELVDLEQLHRGGEELRAGDDEVDPLGVEALDALALRRRRREQLVVERLELLARERQLVERAGDRLVAARRDHVREVLERAAAPDRHLRLERA